MISQKPSEPLHNLTLKPEPALADLHRIPDATGRNGRNCVSACAKTRRVPLESVWDTRCASAQAPGELRRLTSYDNAYSLTPHRVVEFTFDSPEDAARYFGRKEIGLIVQSELPEHSANIRIKVLALRDDYSKDTTASTAPAQQDQFWVPVRTPDGWSTGAKELAPSTPRAGGSDLGGPRRTWATDLIFISSKSGGCLTKVREVNEGAWLWVRPVGCGPVVVIWCCQPPLWAVSRLAGTLCLIDLRHISLTLV
jgi:hypothetical protein